MKLRPHQEQGADYIRNAFRSFRNVLFVGPTAFGKTNLFSYISKMAREKGSRIVIIAHRQELIFQISATLTNWGVEHGIINPQFTPNYAQAVQVASVQTLKSRFERIPERFRRFDLVIQDECHHLVANNTFGQVFEALGKPRLLGVTATPERGDGKGLGESVGGVFETIVEVIGVRELIYEGFLSPYRVYAPPSQLDLSSVSTKMGDFDKSELALRVDKPQITGDAVQHYHKICPGVPAIAFGVSIAHCEHIAQSFQDAGYNFQVIDGSMDNGRRKALIAGLGEGSIHGLVSADLISEGTDIPAVTAAIFLRPTKSLGLYIQQAGRALRTVFAEGFDLSTRDGRLAALASGPKPCAYILDHVGNTLRHGLIDTPREWSLEGRPKKKGKKKEQDESIDLKQCPSCYIVHEPAPTCPACGHLYQTSSRQIEQVDGELHEITPEMMQRMRHEQRSKQSAAKSVDEMMRVLGYSHGRAQAIVKAREEKQKYREALIEDLLQWHKSTGQSPQSVLGIRSLSDLKSYKPKALKEMRDRFEHVKKMNSIVSDREGDDADFGDFLRQTLASSEGVS